MARALPRDEAGSDSDAPEQNHDIESVGRLVRAAVEEVFVRTLGRNVAALGVFWDEEPLLVSEVVVVLCLHGDLCGTISLHCSEAQARDLTRRMLQMPRSELTTRLTSMETVRDATSELVNMIAAELRSRLGDDVQIQMSLPFFVSSRELSLRVPADRGMVMHYDDSSGALQVELTLDDGKG